MTKQFVQFIANHPKSKIGRAADLLTAVLKVAEADHYMVGLTFPFDLPFADFVAAHTILVDLEPQMKKSLADLAFLLLDQECQKIHNCTL